MKLPLATVKRAFVELARGMRGSYGLLTVVVILQLALVLTTVAVPYLVGAIIDHIPDGVEVVRGYAITAMVVGIIGAFLAFGADYSAQVLGQRVFRKMRDSLVETVTSLPLSVVEQAGSGDLLGRTSNDISRVQFLIERGFSALISIIFTIVWTIAAIILVSPLLALTLLTALPFLIPLFRWYFPRAVPAYRAEMALMAKRAAAVSESAAHSVTVDAFALGPLRASIVGETIRRDVSITRYTAWLRTWLLSIVFIACFVPLLVVLVVGALMVSAHWVTVGMVSAVAIYVLQLRTPIQESTFWYDYLQECTIALQRIYGVGEVPSDRTATDEVPDGDTVALRDVRFEYRAGREVLHGITLDLQRGERLAIVGSSGSGKSTLGRMIAGIHPPTSGSVTCGGVEVTHLPEDLLHRSIVLVTQESYVFVGTVADNMRLVAPQATDEEIMDALRAVGAHTWVNALEDGLHTAVGSNALELTPAQAQELALARIILMDPHTVILDEATSLLDPTGARSIERGLGAIMEGRTVISIAHRLWTAEDADRVAVMEDGQIVELGTHDELVALGGRYAELWAVWSSE